MNIDNNFLTQLIENNDTRPSSVSVEGKSQIIGEFAALLGEVKELAGEGVTLSEFNQGLDSSELELNQKQKGMLKDVFLDLKSAASNSQVESILNKTQAEGGAAKELTSEESSKEKKSLESIFKKTKTVKRNFSGKVEVDQAKQADNILLFKKTQVSRESLSSNKQGQSAESLKSSEDFINQSQIFNKKKSQGRSLFKLGGSDHKVNEVQENGLKNYMSEQKNISKSILDPFKNVKPAMSFDKGIMRDIDKPVEATTSLFGPSSGPFISEALMKKQNLNIPEISASGKTLNMSEISGPKNSSELIAKISNYIETLSVANRDQLDLKVQHHDLGKFNIQVLKNRGQHSISLNIRAESEESHKFFTKHEADLAGKLNESGIRLTNIKISESFSSSMKPFADTGQQSNKQSSSESTGQGKQFGFSENTNQRYNEDSDSRRRRDIWEMYKEKMGA